MIEKNKACTKCKETKNVSEFNKRAASYDGYNARCKVCKRLSDAKYRKNNKEKK